MFRLIKILALLISILSTSFIANAHNKEVKMSGPAHNGVIVYSSDLNNLAEFYEKLFNMKVIRKTQDFISLDKDGFNLIVHLPPFDLPKDTFNPVKIFLTVENMEDTRNKVIKLGGKVMEGEWKNPIFKVSNIVDRDGNHIQIREFNPTK
jgi:predicted enzyme related to lactoylglutathione lyase